MTHLLSRAALPLAVAIAGTAAAIPAQMYPIDIVLVADSSQDCVNTVDLEGTPWFIAEITHIHPDLPPLPFEEGIEFRVTGQYCTGCVETFCGSFAGFIFSANLVPVVQGDVNADGATNTADFIELLSAWGPCPAEGLCPADLDGNGTVSVSDLLELLAGWT